MFNKLKLVYNKLKNLVSRRRVNDNNVAALTEEVSATPLGEVVVEDIVDEEVGNDQDEHRNSIPTRVSRGSIQLEANIGGVISESAT